MATSDIKVTEGSGKNLATYSITEDSETKQIQRLALVDSSGAEKGTSGNPTRVQSQQIDGSGNPLSTTKGTQVTPALQVQQIHDGGRRSMSFYVDRIAGVTSEAVTNMSITANGVALTPATSYQVTAGKTLRLTSMTVSVLNTTTVANRVLTRVMQDSVAPSTSSPNILQCLAAASAALAASGGFSELSIPEGIEIPSGMFIAISQLCTVTTAGIVSFCLNGYEY